MENEHQLLAKCWQVYHQYQTRWRVAKSHFAAPVVVFEKKKKIKSGS